MNHRLDSICTDLQKSHDFWRLQSTAELIGLKNIRRLHNFVSVPTAISLELPNVHWVNMN
jgi:hypothetical protein